ncbi:endothelin-converting enzyme homolog isoform X2 [Tubulanus polymorphus]
MTGNKYKRTNFEDDDASGAGTPPARSYEPGIVFKASASLWHSRSLLEKMMIFLFLIFLLVVVILSILLSAAPKTKEVHKIIDKTKDYCVSPTCITVASRIINAMDRGVNPCDDFYTYACGGWIKTHPIPEGHSRWGTFGEQWKKNQLVMKNVLEMPLKSSKSEAETKAKLYYQSCLDKNGTIDKLGIKPLLDLLRDFGGWTISNSSGVWDSNGWDFQRTLEKVHMLDLGVLFVTWVGRDEKNTSRNIIQVDQSGIGLPSREYYLNKTVDEDKVLSAYLKYMVTDAMLLGGKKNDSEAQFGDVIDWERDIANITVPSAERRDDEKLYHKMTIAELQKKAPFINWLQLLNKQFKLVDIKLTKDEPVVVFAPEYLAQMSDMVTRLLSTDDGKRIMHNYMMWHVVKFMDSFLGKDFENAKQILKTALSGTTGKEEKWRECVSDVDGTVGFALGAMFVRNSFHGDSKNTAESMVDQIKHTFKRGLPDIPWMDAQTVNAAREKVDSVIDMIGFPQYILNKTALDEEYKGLKIDPNTYFDNNIRTLRFSLKKELKRLREKPDKKRWSMTPPTINAYYTPTENKIVFPAGILQAPFYDKDYPRSLNYGGIGAVVGHELTHGFDDQGREYDKNGNLRNWWNAQVIGRFKKRTKCMIDQYSKYVINGEHVNGKQTVGENIADNGGLKNAFRAYSDWVKSNGPEQILPGVNLTHDQLFFIGFAQVWCSATKPEAMHMQLLSDPHCPAEYRVIGTLSNSEEFSKVFRCPSGSRMNPTNKCSVW